MGVNEILIKAAQLILSLAFLVTIHEFGHFIPARLFKTKVERFYLFFNPWFSLFRYKKVNGVRKFSFFSKKAPDNWEEEQNTTEWGIGWLPLGGYVKIAGMVDESMDKEQLDQAPKPNEFRAKKVWQRLIIMVGGVTVNLVAGFLIYSAIAWVWGGSKININQIQHGMAIHPYLEKYGVYSGDKIIEVDGAPISSFEDINKGLLLRNGKELTLIRKGNRVRVQLPDDLDQQLFQHGAMNVASFRVYLSKVDSVLEKSNASLAGMKAGDSILAINGAKLKYFDELQSRLYSLKGKSASMQLLRNNDTLNLKVSVSEEGTIGFMPAFKGTSDTNSVKQVAYGFLGGLHKGIFGGAQMLSDYVAQFKFVFTKKGASQLGGFTRIGEMFSPVWDWRSFWSITAFLSFALAFMNILPIPALDGGHVVFLIYEWITGKEAPRKILEYAQYIGFFLLLGLMLYVNGNDIYRLIFK